jgi:uncharacterized protein (TIGR03435 family)
MTDVPDARLLEQFARNGSEEAFAALVQRHIALVHSVALRHTANVQHAQDITQAVFVILARKAGALGRRTILPGWLYHTARLTAANLQRAETSRIRREQEAFMQSQPEETATDALWRELFPQLDEAMAGLGTSERDALVLRYFQNKSMAEVGKLLGVEENTAQKRVSRALEKLRKFFTKRGVSSTTAIIAGAISANSVQAAPVALTKSITAVALTKGAAASGSTLTLIKGALKIMAWTKAKTAIVTGLVVLLVAGTATVTVTIKRNHEQKYYSWRVENLSIPEIFNKTSPQVTILPTKFPKDFGGTGGTEYDTKDYKSIGIGVPIQTIVQSAYQERFGDRIVISTDLPRNKYDYIANLPHDSAKALQDLVRRKFGLAGNFQTLETNVLLLKVKYPHALGLKPSTSGIQSMQGALGEISMAHQNIDGLAWWLEVNTIQIPIVDQTGLTNRYDFKIQWDESGKTAGSKFPNLDGLKQALADQLGLELVPAVEPIEMLVVEKVK